MNVATIDRTDTLRRSLRLAGMDDAVKSAGIAARIAVTILMLGMLLGTARAADPWPDAVAQVTFPSSADHTEQPAMFFASVGSAPRPLLVALHTWSSDFRQPESVASHPAAAFPKPALLRGVNARSAPRSPTLRAQGPCPSI